MEADDTPTSTDGWVIDQKLQLLPETTLVPRVVARGQRIGTYRLRRHADLHDSTIQVVLVDDDGQILDTVGDEKFQLGCTVLNQDGDQVQMEVGPAPRLEGLLLLRLLFFARAKGGVTEATCSPPLALADGGFDRIEGEVQLLWRRVMDESDAPKRLLDYTTERIGFDATLVEVNGEVTLETVRTLCQRCRQLRTIVDYLRFVETNVAPFVFFRFLDEGEIRQLLDGRPAGTAILHLSRSPGDLVLSLRLDDSSPVKSDQIHVSVTPRGLRYSSGREGTPPRESLLQLVVANADVRDLIRVDTICSSGRADECSPRQSSPGCCRVDTREGVEKTRI